MPDKPIKKLTDLQPDPHNANLGSERGAGLIKQSLEQLGAGRSILADREGIIIAGNKTLEQAVELGLAVRVVDTDGKELVVVRRTDLDLSDPAGAARQLAYVDNLSTQVDLVWSAEQLVADISQGFDASGWFGADELARIVRQLTPEEQTAAPAKTDDAEALQEEWGTRLGDLWGIPASNEGYHRILCGDATKPEDVERLFGGGKPNLMVTDPPYGVDYDAGWREEAAEKGQLAYAARRTRRVSNDTTVDWSAAWALFPGDVVYCWHAGIKGSAVQASLEAAEFEVRSQIIWSKPHFPISRGHYHWRHEPCWYAVRKGANASWIGDRQQTTVWEIALDKNVQGGHSTQKPIECMARPIANHLGDVYDPFIGSGTTMLAADLYRRSCFGMEIDPAYLAVILQRARDWGREPILLEQGPEPEPVEIDA